MKRLTKSQYELIASSLKKTIQITRQYDFNPALAEAVAYQMAHDLAAHDTEFNRSKFLKDCGIED